MAHEYGWDHIQIRERFTQMQLKVYMDRLADRYRKQAEAIEEARESGGKREPKRSEGYVSWRVEHERARRAGEVTMVQGN
jgi:hypothetical protein